MYEKQYRFQLTGISPLIMHWDNIEWADQMEAERSRIKAEDKSNFKAGDDRCPPHTWKGYLYHDGSHVAMPNDNLRACLMRGAAKVELKGKETFKRLSQSGILFLDEFYPLLVGGQPIPHAAAVNIEGTFYEQLAAVQKLGFRLFMKRAVVGMAKHVRVRPRFEEWSVTGVLSVVDEQITSDILKKIWTIAGLHGGLCDWRPGAPKSPGPYGRFTTELQVA